MNNIKSIIGANIVALRSASRMTQLTLAEKLCYSDKAVSKWERGESLPDITVIKQIADLFSVSVDYIISDHSNEEKPAPVLQGESERYKKIRRTNRILITLLSLTGVFFAGLLAFVLIWIIARKLFFLILLCCLPVSAVITLVFGSIWEDHGKKRLANYLSITLLIWSLLLILFFVTDLTWQYFLLGVPTQIALTLACLIRPGKKKAPREDDNEKK